MFLGGLLFRFAALKEVLSFPRDEDCLRASNISRLKHGSSAAVAGEPMVYGLDEYPVVAPKMQVVVTSYLVHARRHSDGAPIDESREKLHLTL